MQKLIDTSTAFFGGGNTPTAKLFKLTKGAYAGRMAAIYSQSASTIKYCYADPPYTSWSAPVTIASDAADYPISGCHDEDGNIYIVYTEETSLNLLFRQLTFSSGNWTVESAVTIYNDKENYLPSIILDPAGSLRVCWTVYDSSASDYTIHTKKSTVQGLSWGGGASDPGTELTSGSDSCYCQLLYRDQYIYCLYTDNNSKLAYRRVLYYASVWNSEVELYCGSSFSDAFSGAVSDSGSLLAITFDADSKLQYMEWDGDNWSAVYEITSDYNTAPLLRFNGAIPYIIYGVSQGSNQTKVEIRYKNGTGFETATALHPELTTFKSVHLWDDNGSPQLYPRTSEAASTATGDLYHGTSGKLISAVGDRIYLGSLAKFANCQIILSTAGDSGAEVNWSYHDGSDWKTFIPSSGAYNFDETVKVVRLWEDSSQVPTDWQQNSVDFETIFWIKIEVTTAYSTAPIGTQITPLTAISYLNK